MRYDHELLTVELGSETRRWWTGEGTLSFGGNDYEGTLGPHGPLMSITAPRQGTSASGKLAKVAVAVTDESIRRLLSVDVGPAKCSLEWVWSDDGVNFTALPDKFLGRLSGPRYEDGVYSVTIVSRARGRGRTEHWSHQHQTAKYPGDNCFELAKSLEDGVDMVWT